MLHITDVLSTAFRAVLKQLFEAGDLSYPQFARLWDDNTVGSILHDQKLKLNGEAFAQVVFDSILRMLYLTSKDISRFDQLGDVGMCERIWNVGVMYCLYQAYRALSSEHHLTIRVGPAAMRALVAAAHDLPGLQEYGATALSFYKWLWQQNSFLCCAYSGPASLYFSRLLYTNQPATGFRESGQQQPATVVVPDPVRTLFRIATAEAVATIPTTSSNSSSSSSYSSGGNNSSSAAGGITPVHDNREEGPTHTEDTVPSPSQANNLVESLAQTVSQRREQRAQSTQARRLRLQQQAEQKEARARERLVRKLVKSETVSPVPAPVAGVNCKSTRPSATRSAGRLRQSRPSTDSGDDIEPTSRAEPPSYHSEHALAPDVNPVTGSKATKGAKRQYFQTIDADTLAPGRTRRRVEDTTTATATARVAETSQGHNQARVLSINAMGAALPARVPSPRLRPSARSRGAGVGAGTVRGGGALNTDALNNENGTNDELMEEFEELVGLRAPRPKKHKAPAADDSAGVTAARTLRTATRARPAPAPVSVPALPALDADTADLMELLGRLEADTSSVLRSGRQRRTALPSASAPLSVSAPTPSGPRASSAAGQGKRQPSIPFSATQETSARPLADVFDGVVRRAGGDKAGKKSRNTAAKAAKSTTSTARTGTRRTSTTTVTAAVTACAEPEDMMTMLQRLENDTRQILGGGAPASTEGPPVVATDLPPSAKIPKVTKAAASVSLPSSAPRTTAKTGNNSTRGTSAAVAPPAPKTTNSRRQTSTALSSDAVVEPSGDVLAMLAGLEQSTAAILQSSPALSLPSSTRPIRRQKATNTSNTTTTATPPHPVLTVTTVGAQGQGRESAPLATAAPVRKQRKKAAAVTSDDALPAEVAETVTVLPPRVPARRSARGQASSAPPATQSEGLSAADPVVRVSGTTSNNAPEGGDLMDVLALLELQSAELLA